MKRRDFLLGGSAIAGLSLHRLAAGQTLPCPPPSLSVLGGAPVTSSCVSPGPVPFWFKNMLRGTWTTVAGAPGQRIRDVLPSPLPAPPGYAAANPAGITDAWCGMAVDQRTGELLMVANGGHGDYFGNEAYGCILRSEAPAWKRLSDPTAGELMKVDSVRQDQPSVHADGKPRATHSSGYPTFANGRVWIPFQSAYSGGGGSSYSCFSWDRDWATALGADERPIPGGRTDIAPWRIHESSISMAPDATYFESSNDSAGYSAYDPSSDTIWSVGSSGGLRYWGYNARNGTFLGRYSQNDYDPNFAIPGGAKTCAWMTIAPDLRLMFVGTTNPGYICLVSLEAGSPIGKSIGTRGSVLVRQTGPAEFVTGWGGDQGFGGNGAVYHQATRSLYWMEPAQAGSRIRRLQIPVDPVNGPWDKAWSEMNPVNGPQKSAPAGIYSKFNIVDMGGQAALVCAVGIDQPVYVYKI